MSSNQRWWLLPKLLRFSREGKALQMEMQGHLEILLIQIKPIQQWKHRNVMPTIKLLPISLISILPDLTQWCVVCVCCTINTYTHTHTWLIYFKFKLLSPNTFPFCWGPKYCQLMTTKIDPHKIRNANDEIKKMKERLLVKSSLVNLDLYSNFFKREH